jgi:hypothetical protein
MLQTDIADNLPGLSVNDSPEAQLAITVKEVDLDLHPFAGLCDVGRQLRIQMLHRFGIAVDGEQRLGIVQLHRPDDQPGRLDRKSNRHGNSMKSWSALTGGAAGHLPQVATPVVVSTGVLAAVDPDLVVEDDGDR